MAWTAHTIGEVGKVVGGATPSTGIASYWNGNIPWTTSKKLGGSIVLSEGERHITEEGLNNSSTNLVPQGNLLIATRVGVGKVAVNATPMAISQDLTGIVVDQAQFDPLFVAFCLSQPSIQAEFQRRARGVTIKGIPRDDLETIEFMAPAREEQRRIGLCLLEMDQALKLEQRVLASIRELKRATMAHLFTHGFRGEKQKETEIGLMPESWSVGVLGDLCEKPEYGFTASATAEPIGPHLLRITDIQEHGVNWASVPYCSCPRSELDRKRLTDGDVVVARIGATTGKSFRVVNPPKAVFASYLIRLRARPGLDSGYLHQWMQSLGYWEQINAQKDANLKGGVNSTTLASLKFPLPSPAEQVGIARQLGTIDQAMSAGVQKSESLAELFRALLDGLMSGALELATTTAAPEVVGAP